MGHLSNTLSHWGLFVLGVSFRKEDFVRGDYVQGNFVRLPAIIEMANCHGLAGGRAR